MQKSSFNRNYAIELFRIFLMFGIVWLHVSGRGAYKSVFPSNVLAACVPGFVLITGYFGAKFRVSKIVRLYGVALWGLLIIPLVGGQVGVEYWEEAFRLWRPTYGWWFLHAYVVLMVLSPAIDNLISRSKREGDDGFIRFAIPLAAVVFGWGWLNVYEPFQAVIPFVRGLQQNSYTTLLGIYLIGRIMREWNVLERISGRASVLGLLLTSMLVSVSHIYLSPYNCPVLISVAFFAFACATKIKVPTCLERVIALISPSMFAVFLIHAIMYLPIDAIPHCDYGMIEWFRGKFLHVGLGAFLAELMTAIIIFTMALIVDIPRRFLVVLLGGPIKAFLNGIDNQFDCAVAVVAKWIKG